MLASVGTSREKRWPVLVTAEVRAERGWIPARIHSVSGSGLMIACGSAPPRGGYLEIKAQGIRTVGRIAWKRGRFCGLKVQDRIDVVAVLGLVSGGQAPSAADRLQRAEAAGARRVERTHRVIATARMVVAAVALVAGSAVLAFEVTRLFATPLATARQALDAG